MEKPTCVVFASLLAVVAGIVALVSILPYANLTAVDNMYSIGLMLLIGVLFFAIGGAFNSNGQWNTAVLVFMCFLVTGISACTLIFSVIDKWYAIALIVLGVAITVIAATKKTEKWVVMDRI